MHSLVRLIRHVGHRADIKNSLDDCPYYRSRRAANLCRNRTTTGHQLPYIPRRIRPIKGIITDVCVEIGVISFVFIGHWARQRDVANTLEVAPFRMTIRLIEMNCGLVSCVDEGATESVVHFVRY